EAPTPITGAPTTPLPATGAKRRPKRSRAGLVIGGVVVAVAGVGGYLALERGAEPPAGVAVDTVRIRDTVRVPAGGAESGATARAHPSRRRDRPKQRAAGLPPPAAASQGSLTIDASTLGQVYIYGQDVCQTSVLDYTDATYY